VSGYLDVVYRRPCAGRQTADARRALTVALKQLAESRRVELGEVTNHIRLVRDLRGDADDWLIVMVRDAIEAGHTWATVGECLGVTKQAAHERFAPLILARAQHAVDKAAGADRPPDTAE
jgi:hypoxanthine-guanine phosphoribosyltransferase